MAVNLNLHLLTRCRRYGGNGSQPRCTLHRSMADATLVARRKPPTIPEALLPAPFFADCEKVDGFVGGGCEGAITSISILSEGSNSGDAGGSTGGSSI
eukprot:1556237-Pleurochrysis_carterae.AAC.2